MEDRELWAIIFVFSIVLSVVILYYDQTLQDLSSGTCPAEQPCPHEKHAQAEATIILFLLALIVGGSAFFFGRAWLAKKQTHFHEGEPDKNVFVPKDASMLDEELKKVYKCIVEKGGSVFQGELVRETGFSKVRVTRILDRLEQSGFVERKRRGMANIVVAK